jgi:vacuolar-type H+-ATPase subunit I/STV1
MVKSRTKIDCKKVTIGGKKLHGDKSVEIVNYDYLSELCSKGAMFMEKNNKATEFTEDTEKERLRMSDKKIKKYELSVMIEEQTGTEKDFESGNFDCSSEEEYIATYDTEIEAHQMLGAIQAMIGEDADLAKTIQKLTAENERLKEEVGVCEKLSSDLRYNQFMVEWLGQECGKSRTKIDTEYEKQIYDLKQLLSQWQEAFHFRGERLYTQQAQIKILKTENNKLKTCIDEIEKVSCGEEQVAEDDSEGMGWIYKRIQKMKGGE